MTRFKDFSHRPLSVILPAYNEEDAITEQIEAVRRVLNAHEFKYEIIVVDDGSSDKTAELALQGEARVLRHHRNRGYGAALKTGIDAAEYDTIVITDADGTYPTDQIPHLIAKLKNADMVVGARTGANVNIPFLRRPGKLVLGWLANRIAEEPIPDLNSGLRAFDRDCVKQYFNILPNKFSFTTTITLALLADNYRIVYHPVDYFHRIGKSKIAPRHFMEFLILILRIAILFEPLKIFSPLAFSCGFLGLLKVGFDLLAFFQRNPNLGFSLFYNEVLSSSALLLLVVSLQLLLIGMVADGLLKRIVQQNRTLVPSKGIWVTDSRSIPQNQDKEQEQDDKRRGILGERS
jgi:glycosyltransferase involved in cell wall biosynthesis